MKHLKMNKLAQALSAVSVAAAFGFSEDAIVRNDAVNVLETLQNRLMELRDEANNIQALADAEQRELTSEEQTEIEQIFAAFADVERDIDRREKLAGVNSKLNAPAGRRTTAEGPGDEDEDDDGDAKPKAATRTPPARQTQAGQARASSGGAKVFAQPRQTDAGKWGFRSQGEYLKAIVASSRKGAQADPRLIANAPTSYGSEGVGTDGGFAVPPDFRTTIMQKVMGEDSLLPMTDQQMSSGNSITFPADETTPWQSSGGIQAYWEVEAGKKTESKPALTEKLVKLNKVIALVPMTDELLEDAPAMASYVNRKAPEKIQFKVNDAIFNGTGVGMPLGILVSPGTVEVAKESGQAADTVVFQNIAKMYSAVTPSARRRAKWFMSADMEASLMYLQFPGAGGSNPAYPVYLPPGGLSQAPFGTLMGREIVVTEALPTLGDRGDIVFGDLQNYLSVTKAGGIKSDTSIHLYFDYDITSFRFVLRVGGEPWWNSTVAPYQAGATASGFFSTLAVRA